jgi:hypothetical protein
MLQGKAWSKASLEGDEQIREVQLRCDDEVKEEKQAIILW